MSAYTKAELIGNQVELLIPKRFSQHNQYCKNFISAPYTRAMGVGMDLCLQSKKGNEIPVEISLNPVVINEKVVVSVLVQDITERKDMEEGLRFLACHDPLTGLYNRNKMESILSDEIQRASRYNHNISIFMLDIDHFKSVNDTYGHGVGDDVLKYIAKVIDNSIRTTDYAARYGGEEFIIILPETDILKSEELAERLRKDIADSQFTTKCNKDIRVTVSIGISSFPNNANTTHDLLKSADTAMYNAKDAGRNKVMSV